MMTTPTAALKNNRETEPAQPRQRLTFALRLWAMGGLKYGPGDRRLDLARAYASPPHETKAGK